MASQTPLRPLLGTARTFVRRSVRPSQSPAQAVVSMAAASPSTTDIASARHYATPAQIHDTKPAPDPVDVPRWKQTPRAMTAPIRLRPVKPGNEWTVNEDPRKLDDAYTRMLGKSADTFLSEEIKWLAVTHKSFDHGRRGFNDRLAYLGKRIVELQTSLALLSMPKGPVAASKGDAYGREPFRHSQLAGFQNLSSRSKENVLSKNRLANLAREYGFEAVMRWKPKKADNLQGSGIDVVLVHTLYAIIGALAMQKGGDVATRTVRSRILAPLGVSRA
ncbi:rnase iii domain protein [Diplodia corticola]|uniref:Rnase iii domain protein n=1 Tax=Diplodia corticola TaxID=236234 RepID=A0A1J9QX50_9PEZI|nr:rnase iii domain protein [Diplodia corticola]OJD32961.1 rnase iii domain protein [Diplodia corticola]